jgi:hypothetical protein
VTSRHGMNRFTWDMRYAGARDFPGLIMWAGSTRGPLAPPGRYTVKLSANSVTKDQQFEIRRNTAVASVTDDDLHEQFVLAKQISDKVSAANEAVLRIRNLKAQIADRAAKTSEGPIKSAAESLNTRLNEIEGEIYQYRNRSSQDPLNYPIRLNNKLAALQGIVEAGDVRPTNQAYAVFRELSGRLDKEIGRVDNLVTNDVSALNNLLSKAGIEHVRDGVPPPAAR